MSKRARDPGKLSRLAQAAAISMTISGFVGGMVLFGSAEEGVSFDTVVYSSVVTCILFWISFIPLYFILVRKSAGTLELERIRRLEEEAHVKRTREALKPPPDLKAP